MLKIFFFWIILIFSKDAFSNSCIITNIPGLNADLFLFKNIFLLKPTYANHRKITVFVNPIDHDDFMLDWFTMTPYRYKKIIKTQNEFKYEILNSDSEMVVNVGLNIDSIGYIRDTTLLRNYPAIRVFCYNGQLLEVKR